MNTIGQIRLQRMVGLFTVVAAGALGYGIWRLQAGIADTLMFWWDRVGVVMMGLLPLSVGAAVLVLYVTLMPDPDKRWVRRGLDLVVVTAPLLGFLGTVLGVAEGAAQFSVAKGAEELLLTVDAMMKGVSEALWSTAWGSVITIPAVAVQALRFGDDTPQIKPETFYRVEDEDDD